MKKRRGILIVGQAPSRSNGHSRALEGPSGRNLARLFGHERVSDFADAVNLLDRWPGKSGRCKGCRFPMRLARRRAPLVRELFAGYRVVVVLGAATARALDLDGEPLGWCKLDGAWLGKLPHPSGVNHWWNVALNQRRAAEFARVVLKRSLLDGHRSQASNRGVGILGRTSRRSLG